MDKGDEQHGRRVRGQDPGVDGQLHRGRQRQRRVLRQAAAAARRGRVGRPQHVRRHRLDGEADVRPRLPPGDRPRRRCRTSSTNLLPSLRSPSFDPERKFSVPWQSGMTGLMVNKKLAPGRQLGQRPLRPEVQGQGHGAHRDARHGPADHEGRRHRPDEATKRGVARAIDKLQRGRRLGPAPPLHRQRLQPGHDQRERRRGDRLVGRHVADRRTPTSSGGCRPRAASSGRTTW